MFRHVLGISGGIVLALAGSASEVSAATITLRPQNSYTAGDGAYGYVWYSGSSYTPLTYQVYASRTITGVNVYETRGMVEIGLSSLPANVVITSATLNFKIGGMATNSNSTLNFYGYTGNGTIELADYNNVSAAPIATLASVTTTSEFSVDVTSFIQSLYAAHATYAGILVRDMGGTNLSVTSNYSMGTYYDLNPEGTTNSQGPRLVITYATVPEPASVAILALPAATLLMRRKR